MIDKRTIFSRHKSLIATSIALLLTSTMIVATIGFGLATASSPQQSGFIPTPTVYPADATNFTTVQVGGEYLIVVDEHESDDIFTLGGTTITSEFPRGMVFSLPIESSAGAVTSARLTLVYPTGGRESFRAELDREANAWVARPWEAGGSQPPWIQFEYEWSIGDDQSNGILTEPIASEYWDATREWTRFEGESFIAYLYNYEDIYSAQELGEALTLAIESTEQRRIDGFGEQISYKPILVYYADVADYLATVGSGVGDKPVIGGYLRTEEGIAIEFFDADAEFGSEGRSVSEDDLFFGSCIWADPEFNANFADVEDPANKFSLDLAIFEYAARDITRLYQTDLNVTNVPGWWIQGQADFFSYRNEDMVLPDQRLRNLATINNELQDIESGVSQDIPADDGCVFLNYDLGHSFVNWFVFNYGIESHAELMRIIPTERLSVFDALETVTGQPFLDLENEWRQYIGFQIVELAEVDPASALEEAVDPLYAVGEMFTLTGPIQIPLFKDPGPNAVPAGLSCFNNTSVTVLQVGRVEGSNYYELDCQGLTGWLPEEAVQ